MTGFRVWGQNGGLTELGVKKQENQKVLTDTFCFSTSDVDRILHLNLLQEEPDLIEMSSSRHEECLSLIM